MSQLDFKQITFTNENARGGRSTGDRSLLGNNDYKIFRYPLDIGSYDKGHYMVIHINEQVKTEMAGGTVDNTNPTVIQNRINGTGTSSGEAISSAFQGALTAARLANFAAEQAAAQANLPPELQSPTNAIVDFLTSNGGPIVDFAVGAGGAFFESLANAAQQVAATGKTNFARTIRRTKDTIVLYMPDTMAFSYNQGYNEYSVGSDSRLLGAIGVGAAAALAIGPDTTAEQMGTSVGKQLSPYLLSFLAERNDLGRVAFAAVSGTVLNPMIELLYTTPQLRGFSFTFAFYPRSKEEAQEINRILECLRFHQSPEVVSDSAGIFLVPPSEFDIQFYYNGKQNPNIDRISTCVLERIDIDYAPNGFSAYEVQDSFDPTDGGTGMPVAIIVKLDFKETEYLTKKHYEGYQEYRKARGLNDIAFDVNTPETPYEAFDGATLAGLTINQGPNGIFSTDTPNPLPPTSNFSVP